MSAEPANPSPPNPPSKDDGKDKEGKQARPLPTRLAALWAVAAACILLALGALRSDWDWAGWLAGGLLTIALVVLTVSAFKLEDDWQEWLIEHGLLALGIVMTLVLTAALALWLWVNASWASASQLLTAAHTLVAAGDALTLTASYPQTALLDAGDNALLLTFVRTDSQPIAARDIVVTIEPKGGLTFPNAVDVSNRMVAISLGPGRPTTMSIPLINDGRFRGLHNRKATITVTPNTGDALSLTVTIEGQRGMALRRFVNSTVDQTSPLIFLLLLALPALATLGQKVVDARFADLKKRRRQEFEELTKEFRGLLRVGSIDAAKGKLDKMTTHAYAAQAKDVTNLGEKLVKLAKLERPSPEAEATPPARNGAVKTERGTPSPPPTTEPGQSPAPSPQTAATTSQPADIFMPIIDAGRLWPEELAAAFLSADQALDSPRLNPQASDGSDVEAKSIALARAADDLRHNPLTLKDKNLQDKLDAALVKRTMHSHAQSTGNLATASGGLRTLAGPFLNSRAEYGEEADFLFQEDGAFMGPGVWQGQLRYIQRSVIYTCMPGSGRTTLALAVSRRRDLFPLDLWLVPLKYKLQPDDVKRLALEALYAQVCASPACLELLNANQRRILADLLLSTLSYSRTLFLLEEAQKQTLLQPEAAAVKPDARSMSLQLQRLKRALQERAQSAQQAPAGLRELWDEVVRLIGEFQELLGLPHLLFIYDAPSDGGQDLSLLWRQLDTWHAIGARFLIFVPESVRDLPDHIEKRPLAWSREDLKKLIDHRCRAYEKRINFEPEFTGQDRVSMHFDDSQSIQALLDACRYEEDSDEYSPHTLAELWREAAGEKPYEATMDVNDVNRAVQRIKERS